jgi:hypothetical protein
MLGLCHVRWREHIAPNPQLCSICLSSIHKINLLRPHKNRPPWIINKIERKGNVTVQCKFVFSDDILLSGKAYVTIKFTLCDGLLACTYLPIYSPSHTSSAACLSVTFALICRTVSVPVSPPIYVSIHTSPIQISIILTYLNPPSIHPPTYLYIYSITPFIKINWDDEPSANAESAAENLNNWIFIWK